MPIALTISSTALSFSLVLLLDIVARCIIGLRTNVPGLVSSDLLVWGVLMFRHDLS